MTKRGLGYRPSPADKIGIGPPSRLLRAAPLPPSASFRDHVIEVLGQGDTSSCVAHALPQAIRTKLSLQGVVNPPLPSRRHVYHIARVETGDQNVDGGTYVHSAVDAVTRLGFSPESAFPFSDDPIAINEQPPWEDFREAADQKLRLDGAFRITTTGDQRVHDVKAALAAGEPVIFGTLVDSAFMDLPGGKIWPGTRTTIEGGHALCCVGYSPTSFLFVNSWTVDWSDGGFGLMSLDAMASPDTTDIWVLNMVPNYSSEAA